ncbi:DUF2442 domain-containing protein [Parashewanella spongiae]|uniref:DUF2442 domain-containing protein n=1 Tax=Parashewanella spongiae TaxID=342950 RepID=A0A3A6TFH6_9GAMM|nr:DUF2442 domain-containing protein [Parashewanella spongiae]MCL1078810.1 DUF2442 domain-containing protein [Parashewanella spongiae]RJY11938.1 DUF2442 domain-containing protein [Parashewanella spongiae]
MFSGGETRNVDFERFIFNESNPDIKKYREIAYFLEYEIVDGNLNWHDYSLIFPVEDLYQEEI